MRREQSEQICRSALIPMLLTIAICIGAAIPEYPSAVVTFEKTYGGTEPDYGECVRQTSDGGYVIAGRSESFGPNIMDGCLIKTDSLGNVVWYHTSPDSSINEAYGVCESRDGGYMMAGWTGLANQGPSACLTKVSSSGDQLWRKTYWRNSTYSIQQTTDDGYIIAGFTSTLDRPDFDIYLIKTDGQGDPIWTRRHGGMGWDIGHFVQQTLDGGYVISGYTNSFGAGGDDVYLVKTDSMGQTVWSRTYGGPFTDRGYCVRQVSDEGYIVAGYTYSSEGKYSAYVVRTDSSGNEVWTKTYEGSGQAVGFTICQTPDGGYVLAGATAGLNDSADVYLVNIDSLGGIVWSRTYGARGIDWGTSIDQTTDGGYVVTGWTTSFGSGEPDIYLIKTNERGLVNPCEPMEPPSMRSQGYWRRQCKDDSHEDICAYADSVHLLADLFDAYNCDSICDLMGVDPPEKDMCRKARRQFMGLLLNVASGKLAVCNCLEDSREVDDVIAEINSLLSGDPDFHTCKYAKTLADNLNNGIGIVPCDTFWAQTPPNAVQPPCVSVAPNPFAKSTVIEYEVKSPGRVRLEIYDKAGRLVRTLADSEQPVGPHGEEWDGLDSSAQRAPAGIYFTRLELGNRVSSTKLVLLR